LVRIDGHNVNERQNGGKTEAQAKAAPIIAAKPTNFMTKESHADPGQGQEMSDADRSLMWFVDIFQWMRRKKAFWRFLGGGMGRAKWARKRDGQSLAVFVS
jgi:hypothetical protein